MCNPPIIDGMVTPNTDPPALLTETRARSAAARLNADPTLTGEHYARQTGGMWEVLVSRADLSMPLLVIPCRLTTYDELAANYRRAMAELAEVNALEVPDLDRAELAQRREASAYRRLTRYLDSTGLTGTDLDPRQAGTQ